MLFLENDFLLLMPWRGDLTSGMRLILYHAQRYLDLLPAESHLWDWVLGQGRGLGAMSKRLKMVKG